MNRTRFERNVISVIGSALVIVGCASDSPQEPGVPGNGQVDLRAVEVARGLSSPVYVTTPPSDARLFVVEQPGRIRIMEDGQLLTNPFLDITSKVRDGGERGLLSVAFHPEYATNGFFYVNYTGSDGATRIERYRISSDPNRADDASAHLLLTVPQPFPNHNGGLVKFGPDGMLYIGMGDGGSGGDPHEHGQNRTTLLGAMLRIDVDAGDSYGIPADNPYAADPDARSEIWAIGLRNPWRFSFDQEAGHLYIADVGQKRREEINAVSLTEAGLNFGWDVTEGSLCHEPSSSCTRTDLIEPIFDYPNPGEGCSVVGGYVYRGEALPELKGHYFYGDFCKGTVRSFRLSQDLQPTDHNTWSLGTLGQITSFGQDASGELYVAVKEGRLYRLSP